MTSGFGDDAWPPADSGGDAADTDAAAAGDAQGSPAPPVTDPDEAEGRVYTVIGQDWDEIVAAANEAGDSASEERIVVNMGPQHPSTHGVLRVILTLDGETVTELRLVIGYLHTGIEKNMEVRTWTQGVTFCTRMDYLSPLFNETAYCLAVERLLGIEEQIPDRARIIRVLMMELNRISSHLGGIGPFGLELGATTVFTQSIREREMVLDVFELITGLRMNHAYIRPGGVSQDVPRGGLDAIRELLDVMLASWPTCTSCSTRIRPTSPGRVTSPTSTCQVAWRSVSPARCCGPPDCRGTCASRSRTADTRPTSSTCLCRKPATRTAVT